MHGHETQFFDTRKKISRNMLRVHTVSYHVFLKNSDLVSFVKRMFTCVKIEMSRVGWYVKFQFQAGAMKFGAVYVLIFRPEHKLEYCPRLSHE